MKESLETMIREAFPAEGEASAESLRIARRIQSVAAKNRTRFRRLQLCVGLLLVTTGALSAAVLLDRKVLLENGKVVGTATDMGNGSVRLDLNRFPTEGHPLKLEVRDNKGRLIGFQVFGVTTRGNHGLAPPPDGTKDLKPIRKDGR